MFKELWHTFIPNHNNDYRPYFLRALPVAVLLIVIVGLYGGAQWAERAITTTGSNLAAVVSAVLVDLTNSDRAQNYLGGLAVNPDLEEAAQLKADDMAARGYFAHNSPDGKTPWYWFEKAEYRFAYAGENLAVYFTDSVDVERAWMNSPGHRANILSPHFTEIGIATAQGVYQGQPTTFVVQVFGTPAREVPLLQSITLPAAQGGVGSTTPEEEIATSTSPTAPMPPPVHLTLIKGETMTINDELTVIHEDAEFIAVKSETATPAPSNYQVASQATAFDRILTSPNTTLSYAYAGIAGLIMLALIFLIIFEIRKQRPMSILFAVLLIALIFLLLYFGQSRVVVESAQAAFLSHLSSTI